MKYRTIKVDYSPSTKSYTAWVQELPGDREDNYSSPSPMGFYHYPVTMSDEVALEKLKQCMIDDAANVIKKMEENIEMLQSMGFTPLDPAPRP